MLMVYSTATDEVATVVPTNIVRYYIQSQKAGGKRENYLNGGSFRFGVGTDYYYEIKKSQQDVVVCKTAYHGCCLWQDNMIEWRQQREENSGAVFRFRGRTGGSKNKDYYLLLRYFLLPIW